MAQRSIPTGILRAVSSRSVCDTFGYQLRTGSKGDEATYQLSQPTEAIDNFLSHSWRDSGLLKYMALCWYFNSVFAVAGGCVASLIVGLYQRWTDTYFLPPAPFFNMATDFVMVARAVGFSQTAVSPPWNDPEFHPKVNWIAQAVGASTTVLLLFYGHRIRKPAGMFLDKICIHQTDPTKKTQGIMAIDQFIFRSKTMLICYNDDYFQRLWCCFELGAAASTGTHIVLLPLLRVPGILGIIIGMPMAHLIEYLGLLFQNEHAQSNLFIMSPIFNLLPFLIFTGLNIIATKQKLALETQLRAFSVKNAKCFAESDRPVVEGAIARWFSGGSGPATGELSTKQKEEALARFEHQVREGAVREQLRTMMGSQPGLLRSYDLLMAFGISWFSSSMDFFCYPEMNLFGDSILGIMLANNVLMSAGMIMYSKLSELIVTRFPNAPTWLLMFSTPLSMVCIVVMIMPTYVVAVILLGCVP